MRSSSCMTSTGRGSKYERRTSSAPSGSAPGASPSRPTASAIGWSYEKTNGAPGPQHAVHLAEQRGRCLRPRRARRPRTRGRSSRRAGTRDRRRRTRATRRALRSSPRACARGCSCAIERSSAMTCAPWRRERDRVLAAAAAEVEDALARDVTAQAQVGLGRAAGPVRDRVGDDLELVRPFAAAIAVPDFGVHDRPAIRA